MQISRSLLELDPADFPFSQHTFLFPPASSVPYHRHREIMEAPAAATIPVASPSIAHRYLPNGGGSISSRRVSRHRLPARLAGAVVRGLITFVFATVGAILGAITGALIGLATESGLVRGAGIGAISGAVMSMEVVDSSMAIWRSHDSGIWSVLYVVPIPSSSFSAVDFTLSWSRFNLSNPAFLIALRSSLT